MSIKDMAKSMRRLKGRAEKNPLVYFCPTPPQEAFLKDKSKIKLLLGGNQVGKTMAQCAELLHRCLGTHPYLDTDPPPITAFLITHSHMQSVTIQEKLYEMTPKDSFHPDCEFVPGKGFRGIHPILRFNNGSIIHIKTANQGLGLASATISYVGIDEPVNQFIWGELVARVLRGGAGGSTGTIGITMTPVGQDVEYLQKLVEAGQVSCHKAPLTVEATTPKFCDPIISQEQVDNIARNYLAIDRSARLNGDWNVGIPEGRIFDCFTDDMISSAPAPKGNYQFAIGIDHGSTPNSQVAILAAVEMSDPQNPWIYVLDEYVSGAAPPEAHARAILEMCKRNHIQPAACRWTGDNIHYGKANNSGKMSNSLLMRAFENIMRFPSGNLPWRIRTIRKPRYSVYYGAAMIHSIQARKQFFISPKCERLILSLQRWTMKRNQSARSKDEWGHCVDALRYCVVPIIDYKHITPAHKIRMY
tara:strand:+ start:138 stop:1556 length:1419 start_codon:yes stop_codon:yes gene_type:complete